jgi:formylmethanofuran dehydrogenase subunit A
MARLHSRCRLEDGGFQNHAKADTVMRSSFGVDPWAELVANQGMIAMRDIVIRGGTIIDGTGVAPFTGDVAIEGQRIVEVGGRHGPARREIDATGLLVTPGWVDAHTHYDGQAMWDWRPRAGTASPRQYWAIAVSASRRCGRSIALP